MKLINTIEISPYDYANSEYDFPNKSSVELPDEWDQFWRKCLADKKLEKLTPIEKGSYLVDVNSIKDFELEIILKNELEEVDLTDYKQQVGVLEGGIVIKVDNKFPVVPTCCGDIGNLYLWEEIFENAHKEWKQLWIGHPWIFYRKEKDSIEFSDYYEANLDEIEEVKSLIKVPMAELKSQFDLIKKEQLEFERRIQYCLEIMGMKDSKRIAKIMTGNG